MNGTRARALKLRLTLRWRVAAAFGLASLMLTGLLAAVTWNLASSYMLRQREESATRQAQVSVRLVGNAVRSDPASLGDLLTGLTSASDSSILLSGPDGWTTSGREVERSALPEPLLALAGGGTPARQRLVVEGVPVEAIALPVSGRSDVFVELFPLVELDRELRFLSSVLAAGVVASAVFGFALGAWTSTRALRPLTELTAAAGRVARGDLGTRLSDRSDPDLAALATAFNDTADRLEARVRRDARFAGDVSHELRSPITTMANAAAVLRRRRGEVSGTAGRALDLLLAEVDRFERTVVDLLEISRDDEQPSKGREVGEIVDVGDLVSNVVAVRPKPGPAVELAELQLLVRGDRRRLDRVVANLLDNADRHGDGSVRVGVTRRVGQVRIEVDDAGPGVDEQFRERVFERFARGNVGGHRGTGGGSGLGLAIVAQHVQYHRGTVWVEDRPGGGARFVVELPEVTECDGN